MFLEGFVQATINKGHLYSAGTNLYVLVTITCRQLYSLALPDLFLALGVIACSISAQPKKGLVRFV